MQSSIAVGGGWFVLLMAASLAAGGPIATNDVDDWKERVDDFEMDDAQLWTMESQAPWPLDANEGERTTGCSVNINARNAMADPQPLFIQPGTDQFFHPDTRNGFLRLHNGETIELFCSAPGFAAPFATGQRLMNATCLAGAEFLVLGRRVRLAEVYCREHVATTARVARRPAAAAALCPANVTHIEIGFVVPGGRFLWTMDNCHDQVLESTLFSHHLQAPENGGYQRNIQRPQFTGGSFFHGRNVDRLYTGHVQRQTMTGIVGAAQVARLWDDERNWFLARGHLAARSDFIYTPEQRSTFYLMNAAPQWHSFNSGNWERIETGVQEFLTRRNINAVLYTGTWGVQRMRDADGVERELFLSFDREGRGRIPVPQFYYKVVVGERSGRGIVFVGVNDPHATVAEVRAGKYTLCEDVSERVGWVEWQRWNMSMGYSYACEVNEFVRVVTHLPRDLRAVGLLV